MSIGTKVKWQEEALQTPCIMLLMKYKSVKLGTIVHLHFVFLAKQQLIIIVNRREICIEKIYYANEYFG